MRKQTVLCVLMVVCLAMLTSCASKKLPPPKPNWVYLKDGVTLRFKADRVLNMYEGSPHTLMVCVYQLSGDDMFGQLAGNEDGMYQLLDCEQFDSSVRNAKRLIIHPEQDLTFVMDRMAGTRKVGFVAGYSKLEQSRMVRVVDIPVLVAEDEKSARAVELKAVVNLGAEQIAAIRKY